MNIEIYSFFAGLGFLDLGFEEAGFEVSFVNEYNKTFLEAYKFSRKNKNTPKFGYDNHDICDLLDDNLWNTIFKPSSKKRLIGFIGGPPCPDFSVAGKNGGSTGKNGVLTDVYKQLIIKRKPDFFVLENVKGLYKTKKHREFYENLKSELDKNGYALSDSIENALEYGTPQSRERLVLIGFKRTTFGGNINFSIGQHKKYEIKNILKKQWAKTKNFKSGSILPMPQNIIKDLTVEYWFKKNNVENHYNTKDIFKVINKERFYNIPEGDVARKSFKRLHRWRFSPTAAYGNNEVHLHPYKPRRISVAEALAIQSLPKGFVVKSDISLSSKFKMVGNGVPFLLAKGIASDIYCFINNFKKSGE